MKNQKILENITNNTNDYYSYLGLKKTPYY